MIDGKNFLDQPTNNNFKTYENISKNATGQGDDQVTGCLLDYPYFKENYKMIPINSIKQQAFDADPRASQQIKFRASLDRALDTTMFSLLKNQKKPKVLDLSQRTVKVLYMCYRII